MFEPVIFREYDIRGVYNKQFDKDFAYLLGKSYAAYHFHKFGKKNVRLTVANDARVSADEIRENLIRGLVESGAHVIELGLVTSPISYFSTFTMPIDGAIVITGSHNPPDYNGFKISVGKATIFGDEIQKLKEIIDTKNFIKGEGSKESFDIFPSYIARYEKEFGKMKPIKVVLDCANGAGGCIAKKLFQSVGLDPVVLFEKPDGTFPNHHPDPTVEKNMVDLQKAVKEHGALVGIGFDGDADRIGIVDHTGRMLYGDELMVLISRSVLATNKNGKIIGDVKCSDRLFADVEKHGGQPIMWKTGHSLVKEKVKIEKAPFGGEMSGHIFFADRNYGYDDALYAGLRVCEILSQTGKTIPELMEGLPPAFNTPEIRLDTTEEKKLEYVEKIKKAFSKPSDDYKVNLTDGIRISFKNGWALARSSNTQPVLVLRFESENEKDLQKMKTQFEQILDFKIEY